MAKTTSNTSATGKTNPLGQQIGVVKIVSGTVTATGADGVARILKVGDAVYLDDVIKTADLSFIQIALNTGAHFELGRSSEAVLDNSVLQGPLLAQGDTGQAPDVEAIQAAIQAGQDPTQITPPPAAGPGAGGPGGDDGHSFVVVNFEDQQGLVNSGFDTTGLGFAAAGTLEETAPLIIPPPGISINDVTVNEGAGTATFTVTLDAPSANTVTVNFTTANGSATAGSDYTAGNGIVSFAPGVTSQTITVPITDDNVFEGTENFFVNLSAPVNGDIVDAQGVGTIIDNEAQPGLSINDVTVNESAGTATFTVTLSGPSAGPVTVDFATANGTATSGLDYTGQTGSLSFAPGVVSQTITVPILNDTIVESAETYTVNLTNASGASIVDNQGLGTIIDNDTALPPPPPPPGPGLPTLSINDVTVGEGSTATFTVTLSSPSTVPVTVNFTTSDGTAAAGLDYAANSGTLTFAPGVTSQTVNVSALLDGIFEGNETFTVNLSAPTNATIADGAGLGTIIDGESAPSLSIDDVTVTEGGLATFTLTLSGATANPITVDVATSNGTALTGSDYIGNTITLIFTPGTTTQTFSIQTLQDSISEGDETFNLNLSNITGGATIADNLGLGTIADDEGLPTLSVNDQSVIEGGTATFTVTLSNPSSQTVTVNFSTADGTAISGGAGVGENDYGSTSGTLTFLPGETTKTVDVTTNDDAVVEGTENFTLDLNTPANAVISDAIGVGTIADNEGAPSIIINDVTVNESAGTATFTVTLSNTSASTVTVDFATADGTATNGADYIGQTGTLTFVAGDTSESITVPVLNDTVYEGNETFVVNLTNPTNATIADPQGLGTITDDDAVPTASVAVAPASVPEDGVTSLLVYTVTLDHASAFATTVNFTLTGTATQGTDYTPSITGFVVIAAGDTTGTITVDPTADNIFEDNETVTVTLTGGTTNGQAIGIGTAAATGTITNDDPLPAISINDITVNEGAGTATFTVSLSNPSSQTVMVQYQTDNGTATVGADYTGQTGTVTFAPGVVSQPITVAILEDTLAENAETFFVNLLTPTNATIADTQGVGTIIDNDSSNLTIDDVTVNEAAGTATFTVSLSNPSAGPVTVDFATANGSATAGLDYTGQTDTLTFVAGDTSESITVPILNDTIYEGDETFTVNLSNATGGAIIADNQGIGTITDNDAPPTASVAVSPALVEEDGATNLVYTVTLDRTSAFATTVNFTLTGTATQGTDYTPSLTGSITIPAGGTSGTITVDPTADLAVEPDETVTVTLTGGTTNGQAIGIGGLPATGTILNDDPKISISDFIQSEGTPAPGNESLSTLFTFTVTLSAPSTQTVTVNYATDDGTALTTGPANSPFFDYTPQSGQVIFTPDPTTGLTPTTQTITIQVRPDSFTESPETFSVNLTNPTYATILDGQGVGTILNDDSINISDATVNEAAGTATFTVSLSNALPHPVTVDFATADGTATAGSDYLAQTGTLTFASGVTSQTITIPILNDAIFEGNETFTVSLSNASGDTIKDGIGVGTITDDDLPPTLNISDLLTGAGPHGGDLGEFLRFDTQTSPGNTLVTLDTDGAGPALNVPLVTLTGMVVHDLSALLSPTPDYTP